MCGFCDKTKNVTKLLEYVLEKQLFSGLSENIKIVVLVFIEEKGSNGFYQYLHHFNNQCNSLNHGKLKINVKWKDEVSRIVIWDDVFLHTDKASAQNYGILLMRVSGVHTNKEISSPSGTAEILKILSFIPSTYVVQLSEDQLKCLTVLNQNSVKCNDLLKPDDAGYKKSFNFLLSSQNLTNFKKNGKELLGYLKNINQTHQIFKHFTDEIEPTLEHEEVSLTSSKSTNSNLNASEKKNKSCRQVDDGEVSPSASKKAKNSEDESDDDADVKIIEESVRACQVNEQRPSTKKRLFIPKSVAKSMKIKLANTLAHDVQKKLNINIAMKNLNTLEDVEQYLTALPNKTLDYGCIFRLPEDIFINVFKYLNDDDKLNLIFSSEGFVNIFQISRSILRKFKIKVNNHNIDRLLKHRPLDRVPVINLSIDLQGIDSIQKYLILLNKFKGSIEHFEVKNADFKSYNEFYDFFINIPNLKTLSLEKCKIRFIGNEIFPQIPYLESMFFEKCNDNIFKTLQNQASVRTITIRNDDWTWNGFPHEIFNQMAINSKKLKKIVFIGSGTGSFFDSDDISFKIEILDTTMITFHWYVGIKNGRVSFLKSQLGHLKELTIHKLPFDFDGGKVLKYIIEEMNLDKFYYGKIPLILNGRKQDVKDFEANEIQITSTYEMFRQFPTISSFRFILSATDIASDEIESVINPPTDLFENLKEFEVIDNSRYRGTLGVFLGLFKHMRNLRKLTLKTQDRNINTLLGEFLRHMPNLNEIYLTSTAPRGSERLNIIKSFVPNLRKLSLTPQFIEDATKLFGNDVEICKIIEN